MEPIDLPDSAGQDRFDKMGAIYGDMQDMSAAELDAVGRCVEAIRSVRVLTPPAALLRLPLRR